MSSPTAIPVALAICNCRKANHEHGTRDMYGYHRCKCAPCAEANREYNRQSARYKPRRAMVDAELVRQRVAVLRAAGLTVAQIADFCAVSPKVIDYAVKGRKGRLPKLVQASTLQSLNAIRYTDVAAAERPEGRPVNGDTPRRQVQSLHSIGWGSREIAARIGATPETVRRLLKGYMTTELLRRRIDSLYTELRQTPAPQRTPQEKASASHAIRRARENGWTPETAEDREYAMVA
jgi:hypothetical protein